MTRTMPGRSRRTDSAVEQFERRVTRDVLGIAKGKLVVIDLPATSGERRRLVTATIRDPIRLSLGTRIPTVAEARRAIVGAELAKVYDAARNGPSKLFQKDLAAYSGEIYRHFVERLEDNLGNPGGWAAFKAFTREVNEGRIFSEPRLELDTLSDEEA